jgi:NAD(P)-dependent dehydrogenase (short-subunit alcohol dehydrogenase family)
MKLQNKTILITGASSGLGRGMAQALSRRDNNLIVTARRENLLRDLAREIEGNGSRCTVCAADAVDTAQSRAVVETGQAAYGRIDLAIINAGGGVAMPMTSARAEDVLGLMRSNYDTFVNFLCPMIEQMQGHGGVIAYTGSPAGSFGLPRSGPYGAAKAAGRLLFDACRIELARSGIRFVALYPGFTYTDGLDPKEVPIKAMIIPKERAVREMLDAIERERPQHMFPRRIRYLMALGQRMPERVRNWVLGRVG